MADVRGIDWSSYFRSLNDEDADALALWLATEGLRLGEFTEIVDRVHAAVPAASCGRLRSFLATLGLPTASLYALRKRRFAALMTVLDEALMSGVFPGDVNPEELRLPVSHLSPVPRRFR